MGDTEPAEDLLDMEGMDEAAAFELAQRGIVTRENLADLATVELMEMAIEGMDEQRAGDLIMAARTEAEA